MGYRVMILLLDVGEEWCRQFLYVGGEAWGVENRVRGINHNVAMLMLINPFLCVHMLWDNLN